MCSSDLLDEEVKQGRDRLVLLRNAINRTESETVSARSRATILIEQLKQNREESSVYDATTLAKRERIEKLKAAARPHASRQGNGGQKTAAFGMAVWANFALSMVG